MVYYIWLAVNGLLLIFSLLFIWVFRPYDSTTVLAGKLLAQLAILLFFINVNMYFIFLVIRKSKVRRVKVTLSKRARTMMKAHISLALAGASMILLHGIVMIWKLGATIGFIHPKMVTGYGSIGLLAITLFAGFLRHRKASRFRRKFHLITAMLFACLFLIHLFWSI
ncbi:hypothetical protein [Anoxybacteroides amylolyticum]|uniref:Putative membrane protein n=1 Tax=Anoxybacteroides amylolyticum TaxID=294699 RepID=A0A160F2Q5_9BACL|nr:hypothetical protein [Anoxybacillus amylolyticus]ANB60516.1 putative membrane protein [Anoxybacillus amylolyticus]